MKKSIIVVLAAIVVLLFSGIAICSATQPSNESVDASTASVVATSFYPTLTPTSTPSTPTPTPSTPTSSGQLKSISEAEVTNMGGSMKAVVSGAMEIQILYNSVWTMNPITMYLGSETPLLICTDEYQRIYTKETYPDGHVVPIDWGWYNKGSYMYRFLADAPGTHYLVAEGSVTGQSNVLTIAVVGGPTPWPTPTPTWPPWPTPTPTWPPWPTPTPWPTTFTVSAAWPSSYTYYIGSPTCIYFTVNKPCYARVTYIKQNSNIVWSGPTYVSAGTHTDTGTVYPRGMRTVVVDAWTSSGEYDFAVTSFNVV